MAESYIEIAMEKLGEVLVIGSSALAAGYVVEKVGMFIFNGLWNALG